jgi:invasion protein IalB
VKRLKFLWLILFTGLTSIAVTGTAQAAHSGAKRQFLGSFQNWDAFTERRGHNEKVCYIISVPKKKLPKNVRRGEVYVMVTHWPAAKIKNQVSVILGYPARKGSTVSFSVDKQQFKMFIDDDRAWAWNTRQDNRMTAAMKKGARFVVKGLSSRGTKTTDSYSLSGFTAAYNAITKACH